MTTTEHDVGSNETFLRRQPFCLETDDDDSSSEFYNFAKLQQIYQERVSHSTKQQKRKSFNLFSPEIQESWNWAKNDFEPTTSSNDDQQLIIYEGNLFYKNCKKSSSNWKQFWAILRKNGVLYLYDDVDVFVETDDSAISIDVRSCIADVAYDYAKLNKSTFRIVDQNQIEHLFKSDNVGDMLKWLENLQNSNNSDDNPNLLSNSMALIIKRYEAHSLSVSSPPTSKNNKKGNFFKNSSHNVVVGKAESPSLQQNGISKSSSSSSSVEKSIEVTPGTKHKKWRKSRKNAKLTSTSTAIENEIHPNAVFGQPLDKCPTGESDFVPLVVQLCVKVVERHGLLVVGVYRIPGNTANVNSLITSLDKGFENADFGDQRWRDVNVVSSMVKAFFRKLPDSLLTDKLYQSFIDSNRLENHSDRLKKLKYLVGKLPKTNYETLKYLLKHLSKVVAHSNVNKMQARNLALMFGPSLLRPTSDSMATMVYHMSDQCQIVESLILYCDWIFCSQTAGDAQVPLPLPAEIAPRRDTSSSGSFADINELLNGVKKSQDELNETKDDMKNVWKYRRNSRKSSKKSSPMSVLNESCGSSTPTTPVKQTSSTIPVESTPILCRPTTFNERNIDVEIESRRKLCENMLSIQENFKSTKRADLSRVADEIRKNREENIYAARRIFIGDESGDIGTESGTDGESTLAKMDCLLKHSRHLNGNPHSLDVFSPETREKIRRFQTDNQMLRHKCHQRSTPTQQQRHLDELNKRLNSKNDRFVDSDSSKRHFSDSFNGDTSSVTSDYSTTSSNLNAFDQQTSTIQTISNGFAYVSTSNGVQTSSDYSSNASPTTPRCAITCSTNGQRIGRTRNVGVSANDTRPRVPWYASDGGAFDSVDLNGNTMIKDHFPSPRDEICRFTDANRSEIRLKANKIRSQSISTDQRNQDGRRKSFSVASSETKNHSISSMYRSDSTSIIVKNDQKSTGETKNSSKFVQRKPSKTRKLKVWFKESFRRSSTDLAEGQNGSEIVTKV